MDYGELAKLCEQLSYRDKFRLAQYLIQLARQEEEERNPDSRRAIITDFETIEYVAERLMKSKPTKRAKLLNFIGTMFQFQGGISDTDKEAIVHELQKRRYLTVDQDGRVSYATWFSD
ncbi:MAG: hypothetical protein ACTS2F_01315 [Thainema sp.]